MLLELMQNWRQLWKFGLRYANLGFLIRPTVTRGNWKFESGGRGEIGT